MPQKMRLYELARELGLTNQEVLDLCNVLGIGVKSHSSSIVEPQADRLRRRAERDGMVKSPAQRAEAEAAELEKEAAENDKLAREAAAQQAAASEAVRTAAAANEVADRPSAVAEVAPNVSVNTVEPEPIEASAAAEAHSVEAVERAAAPVVEAPEVPVVTPIPAQAAPSAPVAPMPNAPRVVSSGGARRPTPPPARPAMPPPSTPRAPARPSGASSANAPQAPMRPPPAPTPPAPVENVPVAAAPVAPAPPVAPSAAPVAAAPAITGEAPAPAPVAEARPADSPSADATQAPRRPAMPPPGIRPPTSTSGKPIPPPPAAPVSRTGKPIPPPPGKGGRGPTAGAGARGRPGAPAGAPGARGPGAGAGAGAPRPGGGPGGGFSGPGGGGRPGGGAPGGGGPGGGGRPGGPPGRGGPQRRPPKRRSRRRRNRDELRPLDQPSYTPASTPVPKGEIVIERGVSAQQLGPKLNRTASDVVRFLLQQGEMVTATASLNDEMIELFAAEFNAEIRLVNPGEEQEVSLRDRFGLESVSDEDDDYDSLPVRAPVVTVMGHVDHGKTLLLDRIRNANVVAGEAGGITQHIGAYQVDYEGQSITFLDTPGHEAFTAMRARGADVTDIIILVVAADDGVMPQTMEAIAHAKAADVPIIVAVNKIDREGADPTRVMQQLSEHALIPEAWGGDTIMNEVSALQSVGIEELLASILLVAEVEDLRAERDGPAAGTVLESNLDVGRGPVATVVVQRGTLRVGDAMVAGAAWGRIRAIINDKGEQVKEAPPSMPVQVLGLSDVAQAGDEYNVVKNEKIAREIAETRENWQRQAHLGRDMAAPSGARLEDIFRQIQAGETASLNLIVKADVTGSLEALTDSLKKLERAEVKISFLLRGVGRITENDIKLAAASNATIIGFNVRPDRKARDLANSERVEIRTYEIIYNIIEDIQNAVLGLLEPVYEEVVTGEAEVREVFRVPRVGGIAGCMVLTGKITRNSKVRFLREGTIIWKGSIASLRRFKDDVREVAFGFECGIGLTDYQDLKPGDIIETYEDREIPRT